MKVKDLIKELGQLNQDAEIIGIYDGAGGTITEIDDEGTEVYIIFD